MLLYSCCCAIATARLPCILTVSRAASCDSVLLYDQPVMLLWPSLWLLHAAAHAAAAVTGIAAAAAAAASSTGTAAAATAGGFITAAA